MTDAQKVDARREAKHDTETVSYGISFLRKGEVEWHLISDLSLGGLTYAEKIVWRDQRVVASRLVACCTRLLTPEEIKTVGHLDEIDRLAAANREGK